MPMVCLALLLLALLAPASLAAQELSPAPPPDSTRVLRDARREQAAFERVRHAHLPWTWSQGGGPCDERVGRFCLTHDRYGEPTWTPPPEHRAIPERRERLLAALAGAAALLPGDRWIAGQRVRYLLEAGRPGEATAAAHACRAEAAWCLALLGFARHAAAEFAAADSAFAAALAAMPPERRRTWTELSPLLAPAEEREYRRLDDAERELVERRFWWLADPLWSVPGNDRRTEHFARQTLAELQDRSGSAEGLRWGEDLHELLLRYGWPVGWERERAPLHRLGSASVVTHYAPESWHFLPAFAAARNPATLRAESWTLDDEAARTGYAPPYAGGFGALDHQVALFRRGDSIVVVAGYELRDDSVPSGARVDAALALAADENTLPVVARREGGARAGSVVAHSSSRPMVVSVEAVAPAQGRAGRARFAVRAREMAAGTALSDVLLLREGGALPAALAEAAERALPSARIAAGERVGLFWEVYRAQPLAGEVRYELAVVPREAGWLARAAERIGVRRESSEVRIGWTERLGDEPLSPRALTVGTENLRPGRYTLRLTLQAPGQEPVAAKREVEVVR